VFGEKGGYVKMVRRFYRREAWGEKRERNFDLQRKGATKATTEIHKHMHTCMHMHAHE